MRQFLAELPRCSDEQRELSPGITTMAAGSESSLKILKRSRVSCENGAYLCRGSDVPHNTLFDRAW